jgi:hypothetical protein
LPARRGVYERLAHGLSGDPRRLEGRPAFSWKHDLVHVAHDDQRVTIAARLEIPRRRKSVEERTVAGVANDRH